MQSAQRKPDYNVQTPRPKKRVVKMEGNVAYISNGFAKQRVRQPRTAAQRETKPHKSGLFSTLCVLFIAFCALALLVSRYAALCSIGVKNSNLDRDIQKTEAKIESLKVEIELQDDLEHIHNTAQQELGMTYPGQDQKITIDIDG